METLWVDFNNMGRDGVRLICHGTLKEIEQKSIKLYNGLQLLLWYSDEYNDGTIDKLTAVALVKYSDIDKCWVGQFDPDDLKLESQK